MGSAAATADHSACDPGAEQQDAISLRFGAEEAYNACVVEKMGEDGKLWSDVLLVLPRLIGPLRSRVEDAKLLASYIDAKPFPIVMDGP